MITHCLYKVNVFYDIIQTYCYRGVIMAINRIQTGIRFTPELLYKITYISKQNKRSLNAQLEYLVENCIKEYESDNGEIPVNEEEAYNK